MTGWRSASAGLGLAESSMVVGQDREVLGHGPGGRVRVLAEIASASADDQQRQAGPTDLIVQAHVVELREGHQKSRSSRDSMPRRSS